MVWGLMLGALLAASPGTEARGHQKTRIAVLDVRYGGVGDRKTVEGLSALLASEVARRPGLTVVAGADLRALVGFEREKQLLGCAEGSCVAELAQALGVAYLVSSEVSRVGSTWLLSLTLLDASKAMAVSRLTRKVSSDDGLVEATPRAVDELLSALVGAGSPSRPTRFDGSWNVTLDCPSNTESSAAKGYTFRFPATVKEGLLVGSRGPEGTPGALRIEGTIQADGDAELIVRGHTAKSEYAVKHPPSGTAYAYHVKALFEGSKGTGSRLEDRVCNFTFVKD